MNRLSRRAWLIIAAVLLVVFGGTATAVTVAATTGGSSASCTQPTSADGVNYTSTCSFSVPQATVTTTVTAPPATSAAPPSSSSAPPSTSPAPTTTAPTSPTVTPTGACVPSAAPVAPAVLTSWPSAGNTGPRVTSFTAIPAQATSGPGWSYSNGTVTVSGNCADFSGYQFTGTVQVTGSGVKVHDNDLSNSGSGFAVRLMPGALNVTIAYNYVHGPTLSGSSCLVYGINGDTGADNSAQGSLILANHIALVDHPLQQEQGTIQDNYVERICNNGLTGSSAYHSDSFFSGGGTLHLLTIEHNWLVNDDQNDGATASIMLNPAFGAQQHRVIDGNVLGGSNQCAFAFYGGADAAGSSDVKFTNNQFSTAGGTALKSCYYGYAAHWDATLPGYVWSGNTWLDGPNAGKTVTTP